MPAYFGRCLVVNYTTNHIPCCTTMSIKPCSTTSDCSAYTVMLHNNIKQRTMLHMYCHAPQQRTVLHILYCHQTMNCAPHILSSDNALCSTCTVMLHNNALCSTHTVMLHDNIKQRPHIPSKQYTAMLHSNINNTLCCTYTVS